MTELERIEHILHRQNTLLYRQKMLLESVFARIHAMFVAQDTPAAGNKLEVFRAMARDIEQGRAK